MRKSFAVILGALIVWAAGPAAAYAFEQTPLAPSSAAPITAPAEPAAKFGDETKPLVSQKKGGGLKIPGLGRLSVPKLNFGLDLMYGSPEIDDTDLLFSGESIGDNDVTILGKVKRRF